MLRFVPRYRSRIGILKKRNLWISASAALAAAVALAGCGSTSYFNGRTLPPSGLKNRVAIAIQNPSALTKGAIAIVDAYYDERTSYNGSVTSFSIASYSGALPISIQNMPEEQLGAVYGSGDGSFALIDYANEKVGASVDNLVGNSSSIFITRNKSFVFQASQSNYLTIVNRNTNTAVALSLPNVYRVSVNPGGSVALAFAQNSNYVYYPRQLTNAQSLSYASGPSSWPKAAIDCEPQAAPTWCLFQMQSPDSTDATGNYYGAPLTFDRPIKAVFSSDGGTAYILNCGPECGGTTASYTPVAISPMLYVTGQASGLLPTTSALASATVAIPGGASNALVDSTTMYVVGQAPQSVSGSTLYGGHITVVNLSKNTGTSAASISDGTPGTASRMIKADDNTLWIAMTGCTTGVRYATGATGGYGCLTMFNTSKNAVTLIEPYIGNATGIAAVEGLHKIYAAIGGQVYIYSTVDGSSIDNQFVMVTGTAYDVVYMDAATDSNNTVY
jgi:hypothetical protein